MKSIPTLNFAWPSLTTCSCGLMLILFATCCSGKPENQTSQSKSASSGLHPLPLRQDSGFVTKKDGLPFLIANKLTDTVGSYWDNLQDGDTLGKYYKIKESGHFYYCSIDYSPEYTFETHLIIELNQAGKVLQSARFFHGHYHCCWDNRFEGFNRYGDFFGIKTCSTGSGFCATDLYLFKKLRQQEEQTSIPLGLWSAFGNDIGEPRSISANLEWNKNELIVHYLLEDGVLDDEGNFKVKLTRKMDATFIFKNQHWVCKDREQLAKFDLWLDR
ncbi:hypothetical protein [Haliscomenobacter sp.]|uniref:hypothetical protein n=1 Tax=Haliscomenobacter sp. TaxID=2717303 RepID=UPI003BAAF788